MPFFNEIEFNQIIAQMKKKHSPKWLATLMTLVAGIAVASWLVGCGPNADHDPEHPPHEEGDHTHDHDADHDGENEEKPAGEDEKKEGEKTGN